MRMFWRQWERIETKVGNQKKKVFFDFLCRLWRTALPLAARPEVAAQVLKSLSSCRSMIKKYSLLIFLRP